MNKKVRRSDQVGSPGPRGPEQESPVTLRSYRSGPSMHILGPHNADVLQKWEERFDGTVESLSVEEFLYQVQILTAKHFDGDL